MADCIVLCSGGINSTVAATHAAREHGVHLLHVDFGQRAATVQRTAVREIAQKLECSVTDVDLRHVADNTGLNRSANQQSDGSTNATAPTLATVPLLMSEIISVGIQLAARLGAQFVIVGSSEAANESETESAPGFGTPHLRQDFYYLQNRLIEMSVKAKNPIRLETPLIDFTREEIIKIGSRYNTPFDLTYACQSDLGTHCNQCPDCLARNAAFEGANMHDPVAANSITQSIQ